MAVTQMQPTGVPEELRYYILRDNVMVPLVPVDQLPFQLAGIPRQLSHRQMSDECWNFLKETEHAATSLGIQKPRISSSHQYTVPIRPRFLAPDHQVRTLSTGEAEQSALTDQRPLPQMIVAPPLDPRNVLPPTEHNPLASLTDTFASIYPKDAQRPGYRMPYPSGIEPDPSKKEFCTHWIKTGECAFISVGCKYKHEMPTLEKLRRLGFTQVPRWWKEKSAIVARGPTWMQRRLASGHGDSKDSDDVGDPSTVPDPTTFMIGHDDGKSSTLGELSARARLHQPSFVDSVITARTPTAIATSNEAMCRRMSQVSNLLIDLDEPPEVPLSPQLSDRSSTSTSSIDIEHHPLTARTQLLSQLAVVNGPISSRVDLQGKEERPDKEDVPQQSVAQQYPLISLALEDIVPEPNVEQVDEQHLNHHKSLCRSLTQDRTSGLADSKHATANNHNRRTGMDKKDVRAAAIHGDPSTTRIDSKAKQSARRTNKGMKQQHVKRGTYGGVRGARGLADADRASRA